MANVLIIDDDPAYTLLLKRSLRSLHDVVLAEDTVSGIEAAIQRRPDVVFVDLRMPLVDGVEATRRIRADERLKSVPIILMTSVTALAGVDEAVKAGASTVMAKAEVTPDSLLQLVAEQIANADGSNRREHRDPDDTHVRIPISA